MSRSGFFMPKNAYANPKPKFTAKKIYTFYIQNPIKGVLRDFLMQKHINLPTDTQNALQSKKNAIREDKIKKLLQKKWTSNPK